MTEEYVDGYGWFVDKAGNHRRVALKSELDAVSAGALTEGALADALASIDVTPEIVQNIVNNEFVTQLTEISEFIQNIVNQLTEVDENNTYITQLTENATFIENVVQLLTAVTAITENNTYVTNLITQITAQINGKKGIANELATLDGSGTLTASQIPSSLATDAEVAAAIAALVNSAPGTLDTLKELSDALGADPNFATTLATSLAGKQPLDGDLTAIAALSTTSFGRSLLALADAAALLSAAGAAASSHTHSPVVGLPYVIDGAGSVITTGNKGGYEVPFACTIIGWTIVATDGLTGAIVVDVWKDTYANHPPTVADSIAGAEKPTITATGSKGQDLSLNGGAGWAVAAGDILFFNVDSVATLQRVAITLRATRTV